MRRLTHQEVVDVIQMRKDGLTISQISEAIGVTGSAVWYWCRRQPLLTDGMRKLRETHNKNWHLNGVVERQSKMLRAASWLLRMYEPSRKRRSILVAPLMARFNLPHTQANQVVGLRRNAGEHVRTAYADRIIVEMMRKFIASSPRSGFETIFKAVLKDKPGTRHHALDLYNNYFKSRVVKRASGPIHNLPIRRMKKQGALNSVWSVDFMQARLPSGKAFWIFNAIDDFNREVVISDVIERRSSKAVIEALQRLMESGRVPRSIRSDNGQEFKSKVFKAWALKHNIARINTRFRVPNDNAYIETFNRLMGEDVLRSFNYKTLKQTQIVIDSWCLKYNYVRPHGALHNLSPMQFSAELSRQR